MKILVTGGLGFIGSHFINLLKKKEPNSEVIVIDNLTYAANPNNLTTQVKLIQKNICDLDQLPEVDYIVHFAAESHVDNSIKNGKPFIRTNVEGTYNLIELAKQLNTLKKFIHISTDEVYGDMIIGNTTQYNIADENYSLHGSSYYSATKASSDMLVMAAGRTYNFPYIITRTCNNFGENQHKEKMIPKIIECIKNDTEIPVYGDGNQIREWIYADDNALAIYNIMVSSKVNEIYNIGSGYRITNNELIQIISTLINKPVKFKYVKDRLGHDRAYALNCNKYQKTFGNINKINLSDWLKKTLIND
jgi:dTDP-glucose 4,6-dehydratase